MNWFRKKKQELPQMEPPRHANLWLKMRGGGPIVSYYEDGKELRIDIGLDPSGIVVWRLHHKP